MTFLRFGRAGVLAIVLVATALVSAQAPAVGRDASAAAVASFALTQQMPVDPEVSLGTLPNGMKYYVRPNLKPARRVELRLVAAKLLVARPDRVEPVAAECPRAFGRSWPVRRARTASFQRQASIASAASPARFGWARLW